ncbi:MAG: nucleotidyltransferase family protein [Cellulophaga sp.]
MSLLKSNIAILILAAGESKRMGCIKQLLPWGDSSLLGNAIQIALQSKIEKITIVLGANVSIIKRKTDLSQVEIVVNQRWKEGMGSSISYGVKAVLDKERETDAILVLLADQPYVTSEHLNLLKTSYTDNKKGIIVTSNTNGVGVPVLFDKTYFEALLQLEGEKGAKQIITSSLNDTMVLEATALTTDLDTYGAYEEALKG